MRREVKRIGRKWLWRERKECQGIGSEPRGEEHYYRLVRPVRFGSVRIRVARMWWDQIVATLLSLWGVFNVSMYACSALCFCCFLLLKSAVVSRLMWLALLLFVSCFRRPSRSVLWSSSGARTVTVLSSLSVSRWAEEHTAVFYFSLLYSLQSLDCLIWKCHDRWDERLSYSIPFVRFVSLSVGCFVFEVSLVLSENWEVRSSRRDEDEEKTNNRNDKTTQQQKRNEMIWRRNETKRKRNAMSINISNVIDFSSQLQHWRSSRRRPVTSQHAFDDNGMPLSIRSNRTPPQLVVGNTNNRQEAQTDWRHTAQSTVPYSTVQYSTVER